MHITWRPDIHRRDGNSNHEEEKGSLVLWKGRKKLVLARFSRWFRFCSSLLIPLKKFFNSPSHIHGEDRELERTSIAALVSM